MTQRYQIIRKFIAAARNSLGYLLALQKEMKNPHVRLDNAYIEDGRVFLKYGYVKHTLPTLTEPLSKFCQSHGVGDVYEKRLLLKCIFYQELLDGLNPNEKAFKKSLINLLAANL